MVQRDKTFEYAVLNESSHCGRGASGEVASISELENMSSRSGEYTRWKSRPDFMVLYFTFTPWCAFYSSMFAQAIDCTPRRLIPPDIPERSAKSSYLCKKTLGQTN
jgi:hypothetical protein